MVRQIITPTQSLVTMQLPDEMIGKTIEVIAFEIGADAAWIMATTKEERIKKIDEITRKTLVDLSGFQFNRDEANNYDA
jgi:hypothetical protein